MTSLDRSFVRAQFPAFSETSLKNTAFFENAGGSYMCRQVMDRFETYFRRLKLQPNHPNAVARDAGDWMAEGYAALAPWLGVTADEVYFGPSTTMNAYVLADAVMGWVKPGDEIIVTNQDHEANGGCWRRLEERGVVIKEWRVESETGSLRLSALHELFSDKTKLLTFPHCSNILGEINPVADICALAQSAGVRTVVDGVSFAGHGLPDVPNLGCDIYLFSLYKVYGPHQGVMVIRPDMAELLGNRSHFFNAGVREKRLNPAGPDHAQIAAAQGVGAYFSELVRHHSETDINEAPAVVRSLLHDAETALLRPLMSYLSDRDDISIIGPTGSDRAPTVSITIDGHEPSALANTLGEAGILCGAGHFYSYRLLAGMGLNPDSGVLRFSFVHYTTPEEVARLIEALDRL